MRWTALVAALLFRLTLIAPIAVVASVASAEPGAELRVGVSWSNFQEERWKTDEAALRGALSRRGALYLATDAQSSPEKQLADVESLLARGVDVLVIVAQDAHAIGPAVALARGVGVFLVSHDLHDVFALSDRIAVMRGGRLETLVASDDTDPEALVELLVGGRRLSSA
jgi:ABC-type sugar transport system substrate-binding protein